MKFKHRLRVCNAYPNVATLDVYRGKTEKLTAEGGPMPYKTCREFREPLLAGDLLEFRGPTVADPLMAGVKTGGAYAGTFFVSDLPNNDAVMLLVIHRHDTLTTAAAFESHVFANLLNAQVAIIDVYKGRVQARPTIMDAGSKGARNEKLRFNSVVAVNPGVYEVDLDNMAGAQQAKNELVALNRESYVVLRVGADAQEGPSFPGACRLPQIRCLGALPTKTLGGGLAHSTGAPRLGRVDGGSWRLMTSLSPVTEDQLVTRFRRARFPLRFMPGGA